VVDGYLLVGATVLIVAGYLCGRRGQVWAAIAVLCAAEALSALLLVQRQSVGAWLAEQVVVVVALFATSAGAYRRLRHQLAMRGWEHARSAGLRERARIAAELHDTLGHDLALLSLQAAGIQVTAADPAIIERAAAMRAGAAEATETVRRLVDLLREEPDVRAVIDRARAAGMTVEVTGPPPEGDLSARLLAEALTNAARHAPGVPVTVTFTPQNHIEVRNPLRAPEVAGERAVSEAFAGYGRVSAETIRGGVVSGGDIPGEGVPDAVDRPAGGAVRAGTGLATFAARLAELGGELTAASDGGEFRLAARVPVGDGPDVVAADLRAGRRRSRRVLAVTLLAPLGVLILITTGFYAWAAHDTTIEPDAYRQLHVGMTESAARALLPSRQAAIRLDAGHGPGCEHYTDGNYPLAYDTYEICFGGGVVTRLMDRSGGDR